MKLLSFLCVMFFFSGCSNVEYRPDLTIKKPLVPLVKKVILAEKSWSKKVGLGNGHLDAILLPSGNGAQIICADTCGLVVAFNRNSGEFLWKTNLNVSISSGPSTAEGNVLVGTSKGQVIALKEKDGTIVWETNLSDVILAKPMIRDGDVYVHTFDGHLISLNLKNGQKLWRFDSNMPPIALRRSSSPAITQDLVLSGFANGQLVAINRVDGSVAWEQDVSSSIGDSDLSRMVDICADPIVYTDTVYVVAYQGNLSAFDLQMGHLIWEKKISSYAGFAIFGDVIYVSAVSGDVWAINRHTGSTLWIQCDLQGRKLSKPVIQKNFVVIGDEDGFLHWIHRINGCIQGRFKVGKKGIGSPPIVQGDTLYTYLNNGNLVKLVTKK